MPTFTADNAESWRGLIAHVEPARPSVGKRVKVTKGKRAGAVGSVTWHGRDKFHSRRYETDASATLLEAMGTIGFRVRVQPDGGEDAFFVSAEDVEVVNA